MSIARFLRHMFTGPWTVRRHFSSRGLEEIENAIKEAETAHGGEIRFWVEASLDPHELFAGITPRARAEEVFSRLRVWDTERNNGVLLYLLLADRDFEIVADRAVSRSVSEEDWSNICREIEDAFRSGKFVEGVKLGIRKISDLLRINFPSPDPAELPNKPILL